MLLKLAETATATVHLQGIQLTNFTNFVHCKSKETCKSIIWYLIVTETLRYITNQTDPNTRPMPVIIPPAGTSSSPYSLYAASWDNSRNAELEQINKKNAAQHNIINEINYWKLTVVIYHFYINKKPSCCTETNASHYSEMLLQTNARKKCKLPLYKYRHIFILFLLLNFFLVSILTLNDHEQTFKVNTDSRQISNSEQFHYHH